MCGVAILMPASMDTNLDLPIALRRTRRSRGICSSKPGESSKSASPCASPRRPTKATPAVRTPNSRKRGVRFSDPGPSIAGGGDSELSTGLTPMIRRTSLRSSQISRRHSTPGRLFPASRGTSADPDVRVLPAGGEVYFLPLRQVLDGRIKRRIRRNGLSEEMNTISAERKRRAEETKAEIERLKAELARKDEEIERLHDETVVLDTERVWELEQQVASLKRELASRSGVQQQDLPSSPASEWTRAAPNSCQDDYMELDIGDDLEEFGGATRAELECSTPTRRMLASFPTPPATSPEPQPPQTPCRRSFGTPRSHVGVQATFPDPDKQQLERELRSLQLEVSRLTATLESYSSLASRLSDKLNLPPSERPSTADSTGDLEAHLTTVLQTLSDRTAALAELDSSLRGLGFPGSDAFEVVESLRASFRSARLELEYITPGEITLPLTGAGAAVLDLVLSRLRALAQRNRDADQAIDEHRATEFSLRQQLGARVTAMDRLAAQLTASERAARDKDARIAELEDDIDRLRAALAAAEARTAELQTQIADLSAAHEEQLARLNRAHGAALAERDARVAELRGQVEQAMRALHDAHLTVRRLRVENGRLGEANERLKEESAREKARADRVVAGMKSDLARVMRAAEAFLGGDIAAASEGTDGAGSEQDQSRTVELRGAGPGHDETATPACEAKSGSLLSGDLARSLKSGRKKGRYDSGVGLLDEREGEE
ncbi:uncharacterized protein P884DRAFT_248868 [Thermothelomyces heterothallicus CBS 202.75]|uniref:uncharacterized protein n=1 Tax=Thermothelomyces heterothallicus CBS 202.75 TaxID=1149848 RepID=UPI003742D1E9